MDPAKLGEGHRPLFGHLQQGLVGEDHESRHALLARQFAPQGFQLVQNTGFGIPQRLPDRRPAYCCALAAPFAGDKDTQLDGLLPAQNRVSEWGETKAAMLFAGCFQGIKRKQLAVNGQPCLFGLVLADPEGFQIGMAVALHHIGGFAHQQIGQIDRAEPLAGAHHR